jgi:ABC-type lipopolysaccharide export system ATPase subunit
MSSSPPSTRSVATGRKLGNVGRPLGTFAAGAAVLLVVVALPDLGGAGEIVGQLEQEIAALEALGRDELPKGVTIQSLFEVDLSNADDVAQRIISLKRSIAATEAELAEMQVIDAGVVPDPKLGTIGAAQVGGGHPPRAAKGKRGRAAKNPMRAGAEEVARSSGRGAAQTTVAHPDAGTLDGGADSLAAGNVVNNATEVLRLRRDRLRLAFLLRSADARQRLLAADSQRSRVEASESLAKRARDEARAEELSAELARGNALDKAGRTADTALKALAGERARVEAARATLAGLRGDLASEQEQYAATQRSVLEDYERIARHLHEDQLGAAEADSMYTEIVGRLARYRQDMRDALSNIHGPDRVVPFRSRLDLDDSSFAAPAVLSERRALEQALTSLAATENELTHLASQIRWGHLSDLARDLTDLNDLRIELLARLPPASRSALTGFGERGLTQLAQEVEQLDLLFRYHVLSRIHQLSEIEDKGISSVLNLKNALGTIVKVVALLLLALFLRRRQASDLRRLRSAVRSGPGSLQVRIFLVRLLRFAEEVAPEIILLGTVYAAFAVIGHSASAELLLLRTLLLTYLWYRTLLALVHNVLANSATVGLFEIPEDLSKRILTSARLVGRFLLAVVVFLSIAKRLVGRGYLYGLVVEFFWLGALPIGYILIKRWRDDIAHAYLLAYPEGGLANAVRRHQNRRTGFFVTAAAFGYVSARGLVRWASGLVLRFRRARQAIAFLLDRRSTRTVELHELQAQPALPSRLLEALSSDATSSELLIDRFPHMDEIEQRLSAWRDGGPALTIALVGERGVGKTTWLTEMQRRQTACKTDILTFTDRKLQVEPLAHTLSSALSLGDATDSEAVIGALLRGPRRLVLLDQCQNLFLRAEHGLGAVLALGEIASRTVGNVAWIVVFGRHAWEFVDRVTKVGEVFEVRRLEPWSEDDTQALLRRRFEVAGYRLVLEEKLSSSLAGEREDTSVLPHGTESLVRLLVDRSDGLPRVSLRYWASSLYGATDNTVSVRTTPVPTADTLEMLPGRSRFVLAALLLHDTLSVSEAVRVTRFTATECELALDRLRLQGVLERLDGRYRVSPFWDRAVVRFLRRKHLLYS